MHAILAAYSDSDWAGCKATRRSVSGGILVLNGCAVKCWSNKQATVALSTGEAELYAATKAAAEVLGFVSLMSDLGWKIESVPEIRMDSSAARGIAGRRGLGKTRHIEVRRLWIQECLESKRIVTKKIPGMNNPSDILTKPKGFKEMLPLMERVGLLF